eukprot:5306330-Pleurochrysis_carterae.AAC.1
MSEMLSSSLSHPSVMVHGFFNEGPSSSLAACAAYAACAAAVRAAAPPQHRLVSWASSEKTKDVCLDSADVVAFNQYPGYARSLYA